MISVAIMAHPRRAEWVPTLVAELEPCEVVWDQVNDRHETGLRALQAYDPEASHHMVIQDDAVLSRDLRAGVEKLVGLTGDHPVALYMGNVGPQAAMLRAQVPNLSSRFVEGQGPHWGVGIVVPTKHLPELCAWYEHSNVKNYDRRISRWYDSQGISCYYTAPSLVDHRKENPSLVNGRNGGRSAVWFLGEDQSAAEVVWDSEPWELAPPPIVRFRRRGRVYKAREGTPRHQRLLRDDRYELIHERT